MKHLLILLFFPLFLNAQTFVQVANANGPVYAIAKHGNITMIGGKFTTVNGVNAQNVAWSTDQITWHGIGTGTNDTVRDIKFFNGYFFIAGAFTLANSAANKYIVKWDPNMQAFSRIPGNQYFVSINSNLIGISSLAVIDTILYACGKNWMSSLYNFTIPGDGFTNYPYRSLFQYSPSDTGFVPITPWKNEIYHRANISGNVGQLYGDYIGASGHKLYIHTGILNSNQPDIFRLDSASQVNLMEYGASPAYYSYVANSVNALHDTAFITSPQGVVITPTINIPAVISLTPTYSLLPVNDTMYMGGRCLYKTRGVGYDTAFTTNGNIFKMMNDDTTTYFAGSFTTVNGSTLGNVIKYNLPIPLASATQSNTIICAGGSISFNSTSTGIANLSWVFVGGSPSSSTANNPIVTYPNAGTYQAMLVAYNSGGRDTGYFTVQVSSPIVMQLPTYNYTVCSNGTDTLSISGYAGPLTWSPHSSITNSGNQFIINGNSAASYTVYATNGGCSDSLTFHVSISPSINLTGPNQVALCSGQTKTINISGFSGNFTWSPQSNIINNGNAFTLDASSASTYTVYATNGVCSDSLTFNVSIGQPINLAGPSQVSFCSGQSDTVTISGFAGTYTWSPHTNIFNISQDQFVISTNSSPSYTVYAINGYCSDSLTFTVTVNPLPPTPIITQTDSELQSSAAAGNQWYYTGSLLNGSVSQIIAPDQNGAYSVMVTDANGCSSPLSQAYNYTKPVDTVSTGINELNGNKILFYPNPVRTVVYFKGNFDLIGEDGRMIGSYKDEADLGGFPSGNYLVIGNNIRKKIIKQ